MKHMTGRECTKLQDWLTTAKGLPDPDPVLSAHVASCKHCQGALALLMANMLGMPPQQAASCDDCSEDLPAYAELEYTHGSQTAARTFPQLWWHLWTCPDCSESVETIKLLLHAQAIGRIPAPPAQLAQPTHKQPTRLPNICLDRHFLHAVFAPQMSLGASWNEQNDPLLLTEHTLLDCHVTIHVVQQGIHTWDLTITVTPPIQGNIIVNFGNQHYHAALANGHSAYIVGIPSMLLADPSGPDLMISIEKASGQ